MLSTTLLLKFVFASVSVFSWALEHAGLFWLLAAFILQLFLLYQFWYFSSWLVNTVDKMCQMKETPTISTVPGCTRYKAPHLGILINWRKPRRYMPKKTERLATKACTLHRWMMKSEGLPSSSVTGSAHWSVCNTANRLAFMTEFSRTDIFIDILYSYNFSHFLHAFPLWDLSSVIVRLFF